MPQVIRRKWASSNRNSGVYLDYAASSPVDREVWEAMTEVALNDFGNAAAQHEWGRRAAGWFDDATHTLANVAGCHEEEIVYTSGATESNGIVFSSLLRRASASRWHAVISAFEHPSVLMWVGELERAGVEVSLVQPDSYGVIHPEAVAGVLRPTTKFVSVMAVQNELGTVQPLQQIAELLQPRGTILHVDAAQASARLRLADVISCADLVSISGHKCFGPVGIGALFVREEIANFVCPVLLGGGQQRGRRPGTVPVPFVVGLATAVAKAQRKIVFRDSTAILRRERAFVAELARHVSGTSLVADSAARLPGIMTVHLPGVDATELVAQHPHVGISHGSACHAGHPQPSHVLRSIGLSPEAASECIRVCIGDEADSGLLMSGAGQLGKGAARALEMGTDLSIRQYLQEMHSRSAS